MSEDVTATVQTCVLAGTAPAGGLARAVRAMLEEVARVRAFGLSAREVDTAKRLFMADLESQYLERDQAYCMVSVPRGRAAGA